MAVATLADRRVVSGGRDRRLLIWDLTEASPLVVQLSSPVSTLTTAASGPAESKLVVAYEPFGLSLWSYTL